MTPPFSDSESVCTAALATGTGAASSVPTSNTGASSGTVAAKMCTASPGASVPVASLSPPVPVVSAAQVSESESGPAPTGAAGKVEGGEADVGIESICIACTEGDGVAFTAAQRNISPLCLHAICYQVCVLFILVGHQLTPSCHFMFFTDLNPKLTRRAQTGNTQFLHRSGPYRYCDTEQHDALIFTGRYTLR